MVAATGNAHWRDQFRYLKGIDGTISLDSPIIGGTGSSTFYFEYERITPSASVVAIASATAGRILYSSADRLFVYTDGTAHRAIPGVPRTGTIGQIVVGQGSGTFGLGTAPASADANKAWVTLGSASTGTWAAVNLGNQFIALTALGTYLTTATTFEQVTGYSGSLTFTGSRTVMVLAQHKALRPNLTNAVWVAARLLIDTTVLAGVESNTTSGGPITVYGVGTGGSGDHTFALQLRTDGAGGSGTWGHGTGTVTDATAGIFSVVAWQ